MKTWPVEKRNSILCNEVYIFKLWSNNIDLLFHEDFVSVKDLHIIVYTSWGKPMHQQNNIKKICISVLVLCNNL